MKALPNAIDMPCDTKAWTVHLFFVEEFRADSVIVQALTGSFFIALLSEKPAQERTLPVPDNLYEKRR